MAEGPPIRYVVVCRGPNCRHNGGVPLRKRLAALLRDERSVRVIGYSCFGQCDHGPNVAFYPAGVWYGGLQAADADTVARHAQGLETLRQAPLRLPSAERQEHLTSIGELVVTLERDLERRAKRPWWWPF
jgi:(2Fe-2S) ferredoxin